MKTEINTASSPPKPNERIQMVDLKGQYQRIKTEVEKGFEEVIANTAFIGGTKVKEFADALEDYLSVKHVIPCGNGTDALQIALMALDLKPGDEIITVPFTFVATAEVAALLQLSLKFVDIDPETFTMSIESLEAAVSSKTKCIVPVHLYGQAANMSEINRVAAAYNIPVVEDNAQAIGADILSDDGKKKAGTVGTIGCTSFYPSKNLGAYGDAGAIFTNDDELAVKIRAIANHGQVEKYMSELVGVNSRLDAFQAVVLTAKLALLDQFNQERSKAADYYDRGFSDNPKLILPKRASWSTHVFHQYTLTLVEGGRDELKKRLSDAGIPTMIYYPNPVHLMEPYKGSMLVDGGLPFSEDLAKRVISLPMHTELTEQQLDYIIATVNELV